MPAGRFERGTETTLERPVSFLRGLVRLRAVKFANQGGQAAPAFGPKRRSDKPSLHDVRKHARAVGEDDRRETGFYADAEQEFHLAANRTWWSQTGSNRRPPACKAGALPTELWPRAGRPPRRRNLVGPGRVELPTSRLSGVRSNHLSYGPPSRMKDVRRPDCPITGGPVKGHPIKSSPITSVCVREERETKTAASRQNGP